MGPLGDHGGFTQVLPLLETSPAIDAGSEIYCAPRDQRGYFVPIDGDDDQIATCDLGAFEYP